MRNTTVSQMAELSQNYVLTHSQHIRLLKILRGTVCSYETLLVYSGIIERMFSDDKNWSLPGIEAEELRLKQEIFSCFPKIRKVILISVQEQKEHQGKILIPNLELM
jgi:hypothetical protein